MDCLQTRKIRCKKSTKPTHSLLALHPDPCGPKRALLRYFGGKWAIAPWVMQHLPADHRIYVEPFGGAASVLMRKPRSKIEVYNDLDEEIVGIFTVVQDPVMCAELIRRLRRTPYSRCDFERAFEATTDPIVRAQRAIIRSYQSFHHGSLFDPKKRTFADARHKTGHSKSHEWVSYPRHLVTISKRLSGVIIERRDAFDVMRAQDSPDTLFFVDPPYEPSTRSKTGYRHELGEAQHVALLERLRALKGMVVLAGYPSELYDTMLHDWHRVQRQHRAAGSTIPRTEMLWISPSAAAKLDLDGRQSVTVGNATTPPAA